MIRSAWNIPKSKQKPTVPPAMHATVTFADGSKETVAIDPSAGVDASNVRAVEVALRKQGIQNILKVSVP